MTTHQISVVATVKYKLRINADTPEAAAQEALDIWKCFGGNTVKDWESHFGSNWNDVLDLEIYAA